MKKRLITMMAAACAHVACGQIAPLEVDVYVNDANDGFRGLLELGTDGLREHTVARVKGQTVPGDGGGGSYVWISNSWTEFIEPAKSGTAGIRQTGNAASYFEPLIRAAGRRREVIQAPAGKVLGTSHIGYDELRSRLVMTYSQEVYPLADKGGEAIYFSYSTDGRRGMTWSAPILALSPDAGFDGLFHNAFLFDGKRMLLASTHSSLVNDGSRPLKIYESRDGGENLTFISEISPPVGKNRAYIQSLIKVGDDILAFGWASNDEDVASYSSFVWGSVDGGFNWSIRRELETSGANETTGIWFKGALHALVRHEASVGGPYRLIHKVLSSDATQELLSEDIQGNFTNYRGQYPACCNLGDRYLVIGCRDNYAGAINTSFMLTDLSATWSQHLIGGRQYGIGFYSTGANSFIAAMTETPIRLPSDPDVAGGSSDEMRIYVGSYRAGGYAGSAGGSGVGSVRPGITGLRFFYDRGTMIGAEVLPAGSSAATDGVFAHHGQSSKVFSVGDRIEIGQAADWNFIHDGSPFTIGLFYKRSSVSTGLRRFILGNTLTTAASGFSIIHNKLSGSDALRLNIFNANGVNPIMDIGSGFSSNGSLIVPDDWMLAVFSYDGTRYRNNFGIVDLFPDGGATATGHSAADAPAPLSFGGINETLQSDDFQVLRAAVVDRYLTGDELDEFIQLMEAGSY